MNKGFIVLWRKFTETSFAKDPLAVALAIHILLKANHEDNNFTFNGQLQNLKRGQFIAGRKVLSINTGINESTIRLKLHLLQEVGFCTIKTTNRFSIITICNYSAYQDKKHKNDQLIHQPDANQLPTRCQPDANQLPQTTIQQHNNTTMKTNKVFSIPTLKNIQDYCLERKNGIDPVYFYDRNTATGWVDKNNIKYKDWKAVVRTWEKFNKKTITEPTVFMKPDPVQQQKVSDLIKETVKNLRIIN